MITPTYDNEYPELLTKTVTVNRGNLEYPLQYVVQDDMYGWSVVSVRSVEQDDHDDIVAHHPLGTSIESWLAYLWHDGHVDEACYNLQDWFRAAQACFYAQLLFTPERLDELIGFKRGHNSTPDHWEDVKARINVFMQELENSA